MQKEKIWTASQWNLQNYRLLSRFEKIQINFEVPKFHSIWEHVSNTKVCMHIWLFISFGFFQFFSLSFGRNWKKYLLFQFLLFFPEETYFFQNCLNPGSKRMIFTPKYMYKPKKHTVNFINTLVMRKKTNLHQIYDNVFCWK